MTEAAPDFRPFRVTGRVPEAEGVVSLWLSPERPGDWVPFRAGQHLGLSLDCPGRPVATYTISSGPADTGRYRLTVKRAPGGRGGSGHLHGLAVGARVMVAPPHGQFHLDDGDDPVLLLTAGIGITPAIAMLHDLIASPGRPVVAIHAARSGDDALIAEWRSFARAPDVSLHLARTGAAADLLPGDLLGRLDRQALRARLPQDRWLAYLCGPSGFMDAMRAHLLALGLPDARIQQEVFAAMLRPTAAAAGPGAVSFASLAAPVAWPEAGTTLLELAEDAGLSPMFGCRAGLCGDCRCRLLSGEVEYLTDMTEDPGEGHVLLCCSRPKGDVRLDL